ncbi:Threonine-phosphate decarboxylase [Corynebacterium canis]|uniref:Rv2231c family pyridoxal phosphate-dependent protein CobC n=1 Tax=Corynebacterium canis TaxID=679663 RepID=UPI001FE3AD31|nr:Rv2231c family pyridoxal phosphate-dependent protein CobC [Corynebacterium canis]WJY75836.1 Threonine-phosphate decarboxylase [Corynebacterium canis]
MIDFNALRFHGDEAAAAASLDFAVNVRLSRPPAWLREILVRGIDSLGAYPNAKAAREAVAEHHCVQPDQVMLLSGAAEGFALLPRLQPRLATVVHPSFTEPEYALRAAGVPVQRWILDPPFCLNSGSAAGAGSGELGDIGKAGPGELGDMVVIGNPTNPTGVLHSRADLLRLADRTKYLVVDEAFMDLSPDESVIGSGAIVLRSLTKTWGLAGLRCGYMIADAEIIAHLERERPHWPLGTLQLLAIEYAVGAEVGPLYEEMAAQRTEMAAYLTSHGWNVWPSQAPFLLVNPPPGPDPEVQRVRLAERGVAVRRCDTFPGLDKTFWRLAVRDAAAVATLEAHRKEIAW